MWTDSGSLWHDESGMTTVEYALLLALLTIASIVAWTSLGQRKSEMLEIVTDRMER
jgi:Flp pilus assembly pilin Flp